MIEEFFIHKVYDGDLQYCTKCINYDCINKAERKESGSVYFVKCIKEKCYKVD